MLDENTEKPFYGTKYGAVDHDGSPAFVISVDIAEVEPLWKAHIQLNGTALPGTAQSVLDVKIDFGAVKGAIPLVEPVVSAISVQSSPQSFRGHFPLFVRTNGLFGPRGKLQHKSEPELPVYPFSQCESAKNLMLYLVRGHKDVRIILMKSPHPEKPRQDPAQFVPVNQPDFRCPDGKFSI